MLLPFDHFLRGNINVVNYLTTIPKARIEAMRDTLAAHAHRLHYATIDTAHLAGILPEPLDAFDVAIAGAHRLSLAPGAVRHGLRLQQEAEEVAARQAAYNARRAAQLAKGTCAVTEDNTGCAKGATKGSWSMHDLSDEQLLDECTQECLKCARCNFISVSRPYSDCSWFEECDLTNLEAAPHHHSMRVDRTAAAPAPL